PPGCHRLAEYLENIKRNFEAAAKVLRYNCEQNEHSESCYKLGAYYVTGKGNLPLDLGAANDCFVRSCRRGGRRSLDSCHNAGLLAQDGRLNEEEKPDFPAARDYYTRACGGGFAPSCFNLSALYLEGPPGFPRDMAQALTYSERGCELGHVWACANASRMYKLGDGVRKDEAKAQTLKNRAKDLHRKQQEAPEVTFGT
ncbi:hypothetical protein GDO81_026616, partial [Engystomops pustulosus]